MKRFFIALLIGGSVFGLILALAASLNVSSDTLGAGTTVVASCDTDGVTVGYTTSYQTGLPGYRVDTVTLSSIDAACNGKAVKVTLSGPGVSNASLGEATGTVAAGAFSASVTGSNIKASDVTGAHVVISG